MVTTKSVAISILTVSLTFIATENAAAQWARTVHNWCVDTRWGPIGYREVDFGGTVHARTLEAGPFGTIPLGGRDVMADLLVIVAGFSAVALVVIARQCRRKSAAASIRPRLTG